jgi:hypothetical protein
MPSFGGEDSSQQIWRLSAFPWRLPQLSPEELKGVREIAGEIGKREMGEESGQGGDDSKKSPLMPHGYAMDKVAPPLSDNVTG